MFAQISQGHIDLADFLFLCAAIVLGIEVVLIAAARAVNARLLNVLTPLGLFLVATAFFVS